MRLVQFKDHSGLRRVGIPEDGGAMIATLSGAASVYDLAWKAIHDGSSLVDTVSAHPRSEPEDYDALLAEGRVLPPLDHPEPARFWITGTGLTHIGSADARQKMHELAQGDDDDVHLTDSMKIFRMGLERGKPSDGQIGSQPEWFYKGVGTCVVPPEAAIPLPSFALAGGEEAEVVGFYIIGPDGNPWRIGFALGNEFSDQVTEALNYLYLAHSKLRSCSLGPELLVDSLPDAITGSVRIIRAGCQIWEGEFLSGETNMSHSIKNLEHYHFRYEMFRRPGDLHAYFLGAPILSCASGIETQPGDRFEIDVPVFGRPLRNVMERAPEQAFSIRSL